MFLRTVPLIPLLSAALALSACSSGHLSLGGSKAGGDAGTDGGTDGATDGGTDGGTGDGADGTDGSDGSAVATDSPLEALPESPFVATDDVPDVLFSEDTITPLAFELDGDAWSDLRHDPDSYVPAELLYGDQRWSVAIHIKGSSTSSSIDDKPSLKVDVNLYVPGQEFMGHKKFNLHNQLIDPSMMSEVRSYRTLREAGLPASRAGYVRLTLNGEDYGLYTAVEAINDDLLEAWFADPNGNLYENGGEDCDFTNSRCFETEEYDEGHDDAFDALVAASELSGADWEAAMQEQLDWELFIRSMAMDALIAHWDGYAYDRSNYHIYHDPTADRWTFLPQSMDLDYGWRPWSYDECGRHGVDPGTYTEGVLAKKCLASATCRADFVAELSRLNEVWEAADPVGQVDFLNDLLRAEVESDSHKYYSLSDYDRHVNCVREWVAQRPDEIRAWVAAE
jgi:hypothetical protein